MSGDEVNIDVGIYKRSVIVHVPNNVICLTTQKYRFPIPCTKLDYIAKYNPVSPSRPAAFRSIGTKMEEKDAQKPQYFL